MQPVVDEGAERKEMIVLQNVIGKDTWYELGISADMKPFVRVMSSVVTVTEDDAETRAKEQLQPGIWCHLGASYGEAGLQLYVNGDVTTTSPPFVEAFEEEPE